jgi:hypothetical protein
MSQCALRWKLYIQWKNNQLVLYRGFPGCLFCWPQLLQGQLKSEGDADVPEFTMHGKEEREGDKVKTRWLPAADLLTAQGVGVQCLTQDPYTQHLARTEPIPVGFIVTIPAGCSRNIALCWRDRRRDGQPTPKIGRQS